MGAHLVYPRRSQRWFGRIAGSSIETANTDGPIPGPDCRQAPAQHNVSRALDSAQNPLEVHGSGVQPGHFDFRSGCGFVRYRRAARLSSQHLRQGEYVFAAGGGCFCHALRNRSHAVDLPRAMGMLASHIHIYDSFSPALYLLSRSATEGTTSASGGIKPAVHVTEWVLRERFSLIPPGGDRLSLPSAEQRGLVRESERWRWSSYRRYAHGEAGKIRIDEWSAVTIQQAARAA